MEKFGKADFIFPLKIPIQERKHFTVWKGLNFRYLTPPPSQFSTILTIHKSVKLSTLICFNPIDLN